MRPWLFAYHAVMLSSQILLPLLSSSCLYCSLTEIWDPQEKQCCKNLKEEKAGSSMRILPITSFSQGASSDSTTEVPTLRVKHRVRAMWRAKDMRPVKRVGLQGSWQVITALWANMGTLFHLVFPLWLQYVTWQKSLLRFRVQARFMVFVPAAHGDWHSWLGKKFSHI